MAPPPAGTDAEILARLPGFSELSPRDIDAFLAHAHPLDLPAGVPVMKEGEEADSAFLLLRGKCRAEVHRDGRTEVVGYIWPGAVVGEVGLYCLDTHRGATVVTEEPVHALLLTRELLLSRAAAPAMARLERRALSDLADRVRRSTRVRQRVTAQAEASQASAAQEAAEADGFLVRLKARWGQR